MSEEIEKGPVPTMEEMLAALDVLDRLEGTRLLTDDEETALAVVSDALVALTDPLNLHQYEGLDKRLQLRVKVWHEGETGE